MMRHVAFPLLLLGLACAAGRFRALNILPPFERARQVLARTAVLR